MSAQTCYIRDDKGAKTSQQPAQVWENNDSDDKNNIIWHSFVYSFKSLILQQTSFKGHQETEHMKFLVLKISSTDSPIAAVTLFTKKTV